MGTRAPTWAVVISFLRMKTRSRRWLLREHVSWKNMEFCSSQVRSAPERAPWREPQHNFCAMQVLREQLNWSSFQFLIPEMLNFAWHIPVRPVSTSGGQAWEPCVETCFILYGQVLETRDREVCGISWHRTQGVGPCYIRTYVLEGIRGLAHPEQIHT